MTGRSRNPKPKRNLENFTNKRNVEPILDWSDLNKIASLDDVDPFELGDTAILQLGEIVGTGLSAAQRSCLEEIGRDYQRQKKQGMPFKRLANRQIEELAELATRLSLHGCSEMALVDEAKAVIANLNGLAYNRMVIAICDQPGRSPDIPTGKYLYRATPDWALISAAATWAVTHDSIGDYREGTVRLAVQRLTKNFEEWTGTKATYSLKQLPGYAKVARSRAAKFVECFFEDADREIFSQTPLHTLEGYLHARKLARQTT